MNKKIVTLRVMAAAAFPGLPLLLATLLAVGCGPEQAPAPGGRSVAGLGAANWPALRALPATCQDQHLQALFAPDDPTVTLELSYIDRVRAARAKTGVTYAEGKNPFRIRYAVYNLTHKTIMDRLVAAEKEGVDIQVIMEADRMDDPWSGTAKRFSAAGLSVSTDHRKLTTAQRATADLIGIRDKGLMHLKARIFDAPGFSAMLTGSMNPNQSAGANDETLHLITDKVITDRYRKAYDALLVGGSLKNVWDPKAAVNVLFTPATSGPRAGARILSWLAAEKEQILLMVFSLRDITAPKVADGSLVQILAAKAKAGVPVYVITDRKQSDGVDLYGKKVWSDDATEDKLRAAGVHVYEAVNDAADYFGGKPYPYAAMHSKAAVLGRTRIKVITDASNWTYSGLGSATKLARNVESVLFIDSHALDQGHTGRRYLAQWLRVLFRYGQQSVSRDNEISPQRVADKLIKAGAWPGQPVSFTCQSCSTSWGEGVYAMGSLAALGYWGQAGWGAALTTSAATYPTWTTSTPALLPLGVGFSWKLVARQGNTTRWEGGGDRVSFAVPPVCRGANSFTELKGTWR